jgi:integrase
MGHASLHWGRALHRRNDGVADDLSDADGVKVLSYHQAQARLRQFAGERNKLNGEDIAAELTVRTALETYLEWLDAHGKAGASARNRAENDILPHLGEIEVGRLATKALRQWLFNLSARPRRARGKAGQPARSLEPPTTDEDKRRRRSSANRSLTILKAALNRAFQEKQVASDAAWRSVKPFREAESVRLRYLAKDEARRLFNASASDFRLLVNAALLTGCRYGELVRLHAADFNRDTGTLLIRRSKSGKPRHVILTEEGAAFFEQTCAGRPGDEVMLLKIDGSAWGASHQARPMTEACRNAHISPPLNFHQLRHTYASHMVMDGVPLIVVARNFGHSDTRMVERHYGHLSNDFMARTIRDLSQPFGTVEQTTITAFPNARRN